jgi:hypothetical protein
MAAKGREIMGYGRALRVTARTVKEGDVVVIGDKPRTVLDRTRLDNGAVGLVFQDTCYVLPPDGVLHALRMAALVHPPGRPWRGPDTELEPPPLPPPLPPNGGFPSMSPLERARDRRRNGLA